MEREIRIDKLQSRKVVWALWLLKPLRSCSRLVTFEILIDGLIDILSQFVTWATLVKNIGTWRDFWRHAHFRHTQNMPGTDKIVYYLWNISKQKLIANSIPENSVVYWFSGANIQQICLYDKDYFSDSRKEGKLLFCVALYYFLLW